MDLKLNLKFSRKTIFFLLFLIILFHAINNYVILKNNKAPQYHYMGSQLLQNWITYDRLLKGNFHLFDSYTYPDLIVPLLYPYYRLFGTNVTAIVMTNLFFLIILIFSVYGIGTSLHSKAAGILAAFIVSIFPHVFSMSRVYDTRFHLLAIITLSIYLLLKTERFMNLKYSLFFGLCLGLAAVIRLEFSVYVVGPFCIYLIISFFQKGNVVSLKEIRAKIKNIIIAFFSGMLFLLIFRSSHIPELKRLLFAVSILKEKTLSYNPFFFLKSLAGIQVLHYFSFLFLLSFIFFLIKKKKVFIILLSWYMFPYLFYTFVVYGNLNVIFMLPTLPAVALMISIFLCSIKEKKIKYIIVLLTVLIGFIQFFIVSYGTQLYSGIQTINNYLGIVEGQGLNADYFDYDEKYGSFPIQIKYIGLVHAYPYDWGMNQTVSIIMNYTKNKNKPILIAVSDGPIGHIIADPLNYFLYQKEIRNIRIAHVDAYHIYYLGNISRGAYLAELLLNSDYFVFTNKPYNDSYYDWMVNFFISRIKKRHIKIGNVTLPDNTIVYVYQNEKSTY